ncbi:MAG: hypothetical protein KBT48_03085, partial [Firmicutes bacterium]|nr:hypothetical protein [Bacillota bacterium]
MEMRLTGYDEIETLEKNSIFSFEQSKSMSLFDMKKFIVLKNSLVFIKENQFKWEFSLSKECTSKILALLQTNSHVFTISNISESVYQDDDTEKITYKFTFLKHPIYTDKIFLPEENKTIVHWNNEKDQILEDQNYVLDLFFKIVDLVDQSELELDIKREFELEREEDGPYYKKYVGKKSLDRSQKYWLINLDHPAYKEPWNIEYRGSLYFGWSLLSGNSFENPISIQDSIKHIYGNKIANNTNVEALWTIIKNIRANDTIYLSKDNRILYKFIVGHPFDEDYNSMGRIDLKKAVYFSDVPFNANRMFKNMVTPLSKEDSLISYFEGEDGKDSMDVFQMGQTIYLGPLDSIKEKTYRKQLVYLLPNQIVTLYKDTKNNFYMSKDSYKDKFAPYYDFLDMEIEEPILIEMEEGEPVTIQITDFLTQSDLRSCAHHKLVHLTAIVKVIDQAGNINEVYTPAYYCKTCSKYYILEESYDRLKKYGSPLCRIVNETYWKETNISTYRGYSEESMLHLYGYNT